MRAGGRPRAVRGVVRGAGGSRGNQTKARQKHCSIVSGKCVYVRIYGGVVFVFFLCGGLCDFVDGSTGGICMSPLLLSVPLSVSLTLLYILLSLLGCWFLFTECECVV